MSNANKRKRTSRPEDPKRKLLDELDSLKELLFEQKRQLEGAESEIPILSDELKIDPDETGATIPVLEEVAFPQDKKATAADKNKSSAPLPNEQELSKLIDQMVVLRLRMLKPKIKEEIIEELKRRHPKLFQR